MFGTPMKLSETPCDTSGPAPDVGEHNFEVYGELLGFDKERVLELKKNGVL